MAHRGVGWMKRALTTDRHAALCRNVNATGNATTTSLSPMPPPQRQFDPIVSIIVVLAVVLALPTCCLLICSVCKWSSEQRRRRFMLAEQQREGSRLGVALSVLEGLETGSYKVRYNPPRPPGLPFMSS